MDTEVIQRFLESVGQKADVDLYLKLFHAQEKESFAIIAADAHMVRTALDPFHFDLRILAGIGLYPVVLLGLFDAKDADRQAQRVYDWLVEDQVPARILEPGPTWPPATSRSSASTIHTNTIPIVSLEGAKDATTDGRFNLLSALAARLGTRKVIFLSPTSGLEREGAPHISDVNLSVDYDRLLGAQGQLARRHYTLLRQASDLLDEVPQRMSVAVVSPLALLRELFTVSGAGTLIRKGSRIEGHSQLRPDRPRPAARPAGIGLRQAAEGDGGAASAGSSASTSRRTTWARRCCRPAPIGPTCRSSRSSARPRAKASAAISGRS